MSSEIAKLEKNLTPPMDGFRGDLADDEQEGDINYVATPTLARFHEDTESFVRGIVGPIGSGKSVACVVEIMLRAQAQKPFKGKRRTKIAVIRNTYRELIDTTIQTFRDWIPGQYRTWVAQDMKHIIRYDNGDGTMVDCEVLFRALDKPDDVKKLLSLELTYAWVNEAKEVPKPVIDMLVGRVGRFPPRREGGPTGYGVWMDTNPPDTDHWWYVNFEEEKPDEWRVFHQPAALGGRGENLENLPEKYYQRLSAGKTKVWKDVYVGGQYGFITTGRPIYPEYSDETHTANRILEVIPGVDIYIGLDFGLTPAALFAQKHPSTGQWLVIDELVATRLGAKNFGKELGKKMRKDFPHHEFIITGDPAGSEDSQTDEQTVYEVLAAVEIEATPAYTNDFTIRREAVADLLLTLTMTGKPALMVSPKAKTFRKGMAGAYCWKRVQVTGDEKFKDKPDKNIYSHVCEAGQYLFLGAGEGHSIIESKIPWGEEKNYDWDRYAI